MRRATLLRGVFVIELGDFFSAPYCTKILADLGADVIKIEPPIGDSGRRHGPFPDDIPHIERSGMFAYLNTNKRSVVLDLDQVEARSILKELLESSDLLVENLGQDRLAALGLDQRRLAESTPDLIVTSLSPFGHDSKRVQIPGDDLVAFHASGYAQLVGGLVEEPNVTPPVKAAEYQADLLAGINGATASIASLLAGRRTGGSRWNDVSGRESLLPFSFSEIARYLADGSVPNRSREKNPPNSVVVILPTSDGEVAISPREEHLWTRWLGVMGNPSWAEDSRFQNRESRALHWSEIYGHLAAWSSVRTKFEVATLAQEARVPSFPVNDISALFGSEQIEWREFFQVVGHSEFGSARIPTAPYRLSGIEQLDGAYEPAPLLGEHTASILENRLNYSRERIKALYRAKIV